MEDLFDLRILKTKHRNPRKIEKEEMERLKRSVTNFSKMLSLRPIIFSPDTMEVLGGNQRLRALLETGHTMVPPDWVKSAADLTEEEKRQFVITDNNQAGYWDFDILNEDYRMEELEEWGMSLEEIEDYLVEKARRELKAEEDDYEIPTEIETDIEVGDLFQIGRHFLLCGDSTKSETFEKLLGEVRVNMVVTDPPYNVNYEGAGSGLKIMNDNMPEDAFFAFLHDFYQSLNRHVVPGGAWYIWHADSEGATFRTALKGTGILFKQVLIWVKNQFTLGRQDYQWQHEPCIEALNEKGYEPCLYGWKSGAAHNWYAGRTQSTVLEFDKPLRSEEHPTMKPVPLIGYQIGNSSKVGDNVADGFGGSGTTMVACEQLDRTCFMVEFDPKFCWVIIDRMRKLVPGIDVRKNGVIYLSK